MRKTRQELVLTVALALGAVICALWLWTLLCSFPWHAWNDLRLAPALMTRLGENIYSTSEEGYITTWMYGPVPLWLWAPATLPATPAAQLFAAGVLNLAFTLVGIVAAVRSIPTPEVRRAGHGRFGAVLLCIALWPGIAFNFMVVDNLTVALALLANACLLRPETLRSPTSLWGSAFLTAAALGCKQTSVGIALAQILWLGRGQGWAAAGGQTLRIGSCGAALLIVSLLRFDPAGLWLALIKIPGAAPFTPDFFGRFMDFPSEITGHVLLPLLVLLTARPRWLYSDHPLALPCWTFLCTLPLSLLGFFGIGGGFSSVISGLLLLPAAIAYGWPRLTLHKPLFQLALACGPLVLIPIKWRQADNRPLRPLVNHFAVAESLARQLPQGIWFARNPVLGYALNGRFQHDEDGLRTRLTRKIGFTDKQLASGIPKQLDAILIEKLNWGVAESIMPPPRRLVPLDNTPWSLILAQ